MKKKKTGIISKGNKIIAEYMGWKFAKNPNETNVLAELKYNHNWNELMPVYIKLNKYIYERSLMDFAFGYEMGKIHLKMWNNFEDDKCSLIKLWSLIVEAIVLYNKKFKVDVQEL